MGGRGASSGYSAKGLTIEKASNAENTRAMIVTMNGTTHTYRNEDYGITNLTGKEPVDTYGLSWNEVFERITSNSNAQVTLLNDQQVKEIDIQHQINENARNKVLTSNGRWQGSVIYRKKGGIKKINAHYEDLDKIARDNNYVPLDEFIKNKGWK